jgi:hypothetical protein
MNRFFWDMKYPGTQMPPSAGALNTFKSVDYAPPSPPIAPPGRYIVQLTVNRQSYEEPFEVRKDPRVKASDADLRAQFELMVDIRDRFSQVADTIMRIREVRDKLNKHHAKLPEESRVKADGILEQFKQIESTLTIWMGTEEHPMMWGTPGLTEKLSSLSGTVGEAEAKPTKSMYAVFKDLSKRFQIQQNKLNQLVKEEVEPLLRYR